MEKFNPQRIFVEESRLRDKVIFEAKDAEKSEIKRVTLRFEFEKKRSEMYMQYVVYWSILTVPQHKDYEGYSRYHDRDYN